MKSGFVAIFGKPNVGKSTIMNALLNKKISIVSPKAQTTRGAIKGIYNSQEAQIVFIDTPGIQRGANKMGNFMNNLAYQALEEVDAVVMVLDATKVLYDDEPVKLSKRQEGVPVIVVINKIDLVRADKMEEIKSRIEKEYGDKAKIIESSAINGFGIPELLNILMNTLQEGPLYYERDSISDAPLKYLLGEMVREKLMTLYDKEVPYSSLVICEDFKSKENRIVVDVAVIVERDSQKGIIIGKAGSMLRKLNDHAKKEIHKLLDKQVDLSIFVKVIPGWKEKESYLKMIRY